MSIFKKNNDLDDDLYKSAKKAVENSHNSHSLTKDEIIGNAKQEDISLSEKNPLEQLRHKMKGKSEHKSDSQSTVPSFSIDDTFLEDEKIEIVPYDNENITEETTDKLKEKSILENCLPFIMDGNNGEFSPDAKPSYTLDSVASILGIEEEKENDAPEETQQENLDSTMVFSAINDSSSVPDISDIDNFAKSSPTQAISFTGTMPVIIPDEMITSTKEVNIPKEITETLKPSSFSLSEETIEEEYNSFVPDFEYSQSQDKKKVKIILLNKRRKCFISFLGTLFAFILIGFFSLPVFSDMKLSFSITLAVFSAISFLTAAVFNFDIMFSLKTLLTKRTSAEAGIALSVIFSFLLILLSFINGLDGGIYYSATLLTTLSLLFRSYFSFSRSHYIYKNFLKISNDSKKYGITLIDDAPTTFAMTRNAIDKDVLIAAPRPIKNVTNFIKNSTFDVDFEGRAKLIFYLGLIFSLLSGVAFGFYRDDFMSGLITVYAFSALFSPLTTLACSVLPLSNAASHLDRYGAVLSSLRSAEQIEQANACVIDCHSLFPTGTIKLRDMKVINENNLEQTIACACAITETVNSPLAPIFRNIMETNKSVKIPVADSIKYEDRLGIAGWVGNKRIYIGNRALMLAHEIKVPDAQKDKNLMRDGYFPVYVATDTKVCALLVLRYIPDEDIAKELDRITAMGLTVLINNCDQNISEEMICDYFDLYSDSVKIMSSSGVHMYRNAANFQENMNAGAVVKSGAAGIAATIYCANRVKKSNLLLQVCHMLSIVLGVILFCYVIFGNASYVNLVYVALYQIISFVLSSLAFLFTKP